MSFRMQRMWSLSGLTDSEVRVLQIMCYVHDESKSAPNAEVFSDVYITNKTLAIELGILPRAVIKITKKLTQKGYLLNVKNHSKGKNHWMVFIGKIESLHKHTLESNKKRVEEAEVVSAPIQLSTGVNSRTLTTTFAMPIITHMSIPQDTHNSIPQDTQSVIYHKYIYIEDKKDKSEESPKLDSPNDLTLLSQKKVSTSLINEMLNSHGRTYKQMADMINHLNTLDIDATIYDGALKRLSYLTYVERHPVNSIANKMKAYLDAKKPKLTVVRSNPAHIFVDQVRPDSLCNPNYVRTAEEKQRGLDELRRMIGR